MTEVRFPKTLAQAYREATADVVVYKVGVALRIIWEVAKPIIGWVVFLSAVMVIGFFYFFFKLIVDSLRP
jgi:hypothetical protein